MNSVMTPLEVALTTAAWYDGIKLMQIDFRRRYQPAIGIEEAEDTYRLLSTLYHEFCSTQQLKETVVLLEEDGVTTWQPINSSCMKNKLHAIMQLINSDMSDVMANRKLALDNREAVLIAYGTHFLLNYVPVKEEDYNDKEDNTIKGVINGTLNSKVTTAMRSELVEAIELLWDTGYCTSL